jgi:hypothetical protein
LLHEQTDDVLNACRRSGLRLASRTANGDWPCLHLRKRRRSGWRRPERWTSDPAQIAPGHGSL